MFEIWFLNFEQISTLGRNSFLRTNWPNSLPRFELNDCKQKKCRIWNRFIRDCWEKRILASKKILMCSLTKSCYIPKATMTFAFSDFSLNTCFKIRIGLKVHDSRIFKGNVSGMLSWMARNSMPATSNWIHWILFSGRFNGVYNDLPDMRSNFAHAEPLGRVSSMSR